MPDSILPQIISRSDAKALGLTMYFPGTACRYGHISERYTRNGECRACVATTGRKRALKWKQENKERVSEYQKEYEKKNREAINARARAYNKHYRADNKKKISDRTCEWRRRNIESIRLRESKYRKKNKEKIKEYSTRCYRKNPYKQLAYCRLHQVRKKRACPPWANLEAIRLIYKHCPPGHHVDHVIPLKGVTPEGNRVCGLHVEYNLRYLPGPDNVSRGNRIAEHELQELESISI